MITDSPSRVVANEVVNSVIRSVHLPFIYLSKAFKQKGLPTHTMHFMQISMTIRFRLLPFKYKQGTRCIKNYFAVKLHRFGFVASVVLTPKWSSLRHLKTEEFTSVADNSSVGGLLSVGTTDSASNASFQSSASLIDVHFSFSDFPPPP